ncbi:ankyrin, partial [Mytilinidion resinicola]
SPLRYAFSRGYLEIVDVLLGHDGVDINLQDSRGWTELHSAIEAPEASHCRNIVQLLLDHQEVNVNAMTSDGQTALHLAAGRNGHEVVQMFLSHQDVKVNAVNSDGETALHLA